MAISNITTKQDSFVKAVETLDKYKTDILQTLDMEIETKKIDLQDMEQEYKHLKKSGQIDTDQFLKEYRYKGALEILEEEGEVSIKEDDLDELKREVESLRQERSEELEKLKKEERGKAKHVLDDALSRAELKHKAEIAELSAEATQQKREIATLQSTIDNLKNELSEQRKLTKDVAQASRAAPITQNMAK